jgi:hypothetical protein
MFLALMFDRDGSVACLLQGIELGLSYFASVGFRYMDEYGVNRRMQIL